MEIKTTRELTDWAVKNNRAVCAFNVNNMELIQAVTQTANELRVPIILQVTAGARKYAGIAYIRKLVEAAVESINVPVALHLDHGDSFEVCKDAIDSGFTSVMIDGSHLPFEENVALTKRVVEYAKTLAPNGAPPLRKGEFSRGVSVEGELGMIAGIEDNVSQEKSRYTDPRQAAEFVKRTGVDALAVSIGTAHGAFKYSKEPNLRFDILAEINKAVPGTALVLHGASSVTPGDVATINKYGGKIENARGVSEAVLAKAIPLGVRKINIDSDLRLAMTAKLREYFAKEPAHFDPRQYLGAAREHVKGVVKRKLLAFTVAE